MLRRLTPGRSGGRARASVATSPNALPVPTDAHHAGETPFAPPDAWNIDSLTAPKPVQAGEVPQSRPRRCGADRGVPAEDHRRHQDRLRSRNPRRHLRARPGVRDSRRRHQPRARAHDAHESRVPVGAADSAGSPVQGQSDSGHR